MIRWKILKKWSGKDVRFWKRYRLDVVYAKHCFVDNIYFKEYLESLESEESSGVES